jgi:hypothetical protein
MSHYSEHDSRKIFLLLPLRFHLFCCGTCTSALPTTSLVPVLIQNSQPIFQSDQKEGISTILFNPPTILSPKMPSSNRTCMPLQTDLELIRSSSQDTWSPITRQSVDWFTYLSCYPNAFVVRAKCVLAGNPASYLDKFESMIRNDNVGDGAINVVVKTGEFSVSASSPLRCCFTMLLVYPTQTAFDAGRFSTNANLTDAYITYEMLDCFLLRRAVIRGDADAGEGMRMLSDSLARLRPASSLFLKLTATHSEECLRLIRDLSVTCTPDRVADLVGSRSVHRLVASLPSCMLQTALDTMSLVTPSADWGYVAYNTLLRFASDEAKLNQV